MSDKTAEEAENAAKSIASVWRLSQLLNVTIEDAAAIYMKVGAALAAAEATRKSAS